MLADSVGGRPGEETARVIMILIDCLTLSY